MTLYLKEQHCSCHMLSAGPKAWGRWALSSEVLVLDTFTPPWILGLVTTEPWSCTILAWWMSVMGQKSEGCTPGRRWEHMEEMSQVYRASTARSLSSSLVGQMVTEAMAVHGEVAEWRLLQPDPHPGVPLSSHGPWLLRAIFPSCHYPAMGTDLLWGPVFNVPWKSQ